MYAQQTHQHAQETDVLIDALFVSSIFISFAQIKDPLVSYNPSLDFSMLANLSHLSKIHASSLSNNCPFI